MGADHLTFMLTYAWYTCRGEGQPAGTEQLLQSIPGVRGNLGPGRVFSGPDGRLAFDMRNEPLAMIDGGPDTRGQPVGATDGVGRHEITTWFDKQLWHFSDPGSQT